MVDLKGFNRHKKKSWKFSNLESARRPVPHCETVFVPQSSHLLDISTNWNDVHESLKSSCDSGGSVYEGNYTIPEQSSQKNLSDLLGILIYPKTLQKYWHRGLKTKIALEQERK